MSRELNTVQSQYNNFVTVGDITVEIRILRSDIDPAWSLEVIKSNGTSKVWNKLFKSDDEAYAEFCRAAEQEGMRSFFEDEASRNVILFPHLH